MPPVSSRLAATFAFALLAACGGKSSTPAAPPGPLQLACSVSLSGPAPVLQVLARATTKAATGAPGIAVTLQTQPTPQTLTLTGPSWTGSKEIRGASVSPGAWVTAAATIDGVAVTSSCIAYPGLPAVTARITRTATGADLSWDAVAGAAIYRWTLRDGPDGALVASGSSSGTSAQAVATLGLTTPYVAEVGAYALTGAEASYPASLPTPQASFGRALFTSGNGGGDGISAWQLFGPGDYVNGTLTAGFPTLGANERLAVLLDNAGGDDAGYATVSVVGTGAALVAPAAAPLTAMAAARPATGLAADVDRSDAMAGEALVAAQREETMARLRDGRLQREPALSTGSLRAATAPAALPTTRSFCQGKISAAGSWSYVWTGATLAYETPNAAFYYTDDVKAGIDQALAVRPDFFTTLGAAYGTSTTGILGTLNEYFGAETDVDGNGKMVFLFGNLGKTTAGGFVVGYFDPADIELPLATVATCPRRTSGNRTDMLYLLDPATFTTNWAGRGADYKAVLDLILGGEYQGVMAHELQHDVNYNTHCPIGGTCGVDEEIWLNEGLSMLSETVAGFGLHGTSSRSAVRYYQGTASTGLPYYQGYSMTAWAGDAIGNYAGVQAYMQYLLDHASPAMTKALHSKWVAGKANVEAATGVPWELGFARFATAAMFSNEDTSAPSGALGSITSAGNLLANPIFNYLGDGVAPDYVPWHRMMGNCGTTPVPRMANVAYTPINGSTGATLRRDGWAAFATGPGSGGAATIRVQSAAAVRPHVVVVKYTGTLPNYVAPTCP